MTLEQKIRKGPITKTDFWFSKAPKTQLFNGYFQSPVNKDIPGMKRSSFYTIHIDLTKDAESLLAEMDKGTSYEIRRAEREGIRCDAEGSKEDFAIFFNAFAADKGIEGTNLNYMQYSAPMVITRAFCGDDLLVMHAYIEDEHRGRLNMSASRLIKEQEDFKKTRALIGYANRYLHFQDMLHFKKTGKNIYDFGGYAKGTEDKTLDGINKFKLGFGGTIVEEFNYRSKFLP